MRINFKKGAGEIIGFAISAVILTSFLLIMVGIFSMDQSIKTMDEVAQNVARDIVVCESIDMAEKLCDKNVHEYLKNEHNLTNITTKVEYTKGFPKLWTRGNFITITITADIKTASQVTNIKNAKTTVISMIERGDEG